MTIVPQSATSDERSDILHGWKRDVVADIGALLQPPSDFPCLFSQNAYRRRNLLFSFIEGRGDEDVRQSALDLAEYIERARAWDGTVNTAEPLVIAWNPETVRGSSCDEYNRIGWTILQEWHDADPAPWPETVAEQPQSPFWTMCFNGMQIFVNISHPHHRIRQSRNLGKALTFVVNPRERFDIVAGNTPAGRLVRNRIRSRVEAYDGQPHSPDLGSYQAGELEWPQYGLAETNEPHQGKCPFRFAGRTRLRSRLCDACSGPVPCTQCDR